MSLFWLILLFHAVAIAAVVAVGRRSAVGATLIAAAPVAVAGVWGFASLVSPPAVDPQADRSWVDGLDLTFAFRLTPFSAMLTAAVGLIGVLVVVYAHGYFTRVEGRFLATLLAFAGSMLGLVWADSVWTLFIFWEATSVTSFLLVGHNRTNEAAKVAARRALVITGVGGLVLLAGFLVLADAAGTATLSAMGPVDGTAATVAAVLIVVAAATKSALVPFHVWLPGAMAAPTPVSAYLHSATMVKAGVVLIAVTGPILGGVAAFRIAALAFGTAAMFWGAIGALRQRDAKLILAWGTVSQLGLLVVLFATGSGKATFAAVSLLAAHAVFKAALFMVVGEVDIRTGTRDIDQLRGLAGSMPLAAGIATACGLSMAGVPPLVGFPAKEAAVEAMLGLEGGERIVIGGAVIGAAVLTVAYTVHFLVGVFGPFREAADAPTQVAATRWAMAVPPAVLAVASFVGWIIAGRVGEPLARAAAHLDAGASKYTLIAWPGATTAFFTSLGIVVVGAAIGWLRTTRSLAVPATVGATAVDRMVDGITRPARRLTGVMQHGSLPFYIATMATVVAATTIPFAWGLFDSGIDVRIADTPMQAGLALATIVAAWSATRVDSRIGAALALGVVGLAVTGLFVVHGAPDLVLTQLLVETVVVVGFVVGLGRLQRSFPATSAQWRLIRAGVAAASALGVTVALLAASSSSRAMLPTAELVEEAVEVGGGNNIVNVVLTDTRGLDTLGEIIVLAVVALGVLALVGHRPSTRTRDADSDNDPPVPDSPTTASSTRKART